MSVHVLYLSANGDGFTYMLNASNAPAPPPKLEEALACKTHEAVRDFLRNLGDEDYTLCHYNRPKDPLHERDGGIAHECSLQHMTAFVQLRIDKRSAAHVIFDKIGKVLGHSLEYLASKTTVPFIGVIPGVAIVGIGLSQIVGGVALSILSAIPAYVFQSKNAQFIVQRSIKHIGHGPGNIIYGVFLGTPFLGTWIYSKFQEFESAKSAKFKLEKSIFQGVIN